MSKNDLIACNPALISLLFYEDKLWGDTIMVPLIIQARETDIFHGLPADNARMLTSILFLIGYELGVPDNIPAGKRNIQAIIPMIYQQFCLKEPMIKKIDPESKTDIALVSTYFNQVLNTGLYFKALVFHQSNDGGDGGGKDVPPADDNPHTMKDFIESLDLTDFEKETERIPVELK